MVPYIMPRVPSEIDRLDLQHYALQQALGANHLAPIHRPARVLDVGAGTGQWAFDLCEQFSDATVVGFDLVPSKPTGPASYRCVRGNLLQGLPFVDGAFDFVHQRAMLVAIPVANWKGVVAELARVTRSGGWVELVENVPTTDPMGSAMQAVTTLFRQVASARGLDSTGVVYAGIDRWLREAGAEDVVRRETTLPIGEWAGPIGSMLATDLRNALQQILGLLVRQCRFTEVEGRDLLIAIQREWEELRPAIPVAIAYGRKR
jgi:ubiquinone/menaquinone biosynthesis C-methylase UbiE